jgi:hypothetical protein
MSEKVQVVGARELASSLRAASDDLADMTAAQDRAGEYLVQTARRLAPRRTGRLAGTVRAHVAGPAVSVTAGGVSVPYAGPIHYGWFARNIQPQPFLTDALQQGEPAVVNIYEDQVQRTCAQVHGK